MDVRHIIGKEDGSYTVEFNTKEGEACLIIAEDGMIREIHLPPMSFKPHQHGLITALFMAYALHRQDWREETKEAFCKALEERTKGEEHSDPAMAIIFKMVLEMGK